MRIYVDTSFLISLYTPDANSAAAARTMSSSGGDHYITVLGELEAINAMELRVFRKELTRAQVQSSFKAFASDLASGLFHLCPLSDQALMRARELSQQITARLGTRTADLLHVAAALELGVDVLYSFDRQQRKLAQAVSLKLN